jgi:hypothetical protein
MEEETSNERWYDKDPKMAEILELLHSLTREEQEELSVSLIQFVNMLRESRSDEETPISIGKNRVLGLYKSFHKRRWYDKNMSLMSAMNTISTLPIDDCKKITEGLILSYKD